MFNVKMHSQVYLLKLSSLSPDLERVNESVYRLPVSDRDVKRLQSLNRAWAAHSAHLSERFRYLKPLDFTSNNCAACKNLTLHHTTEL